MRSLSLSLSATACGTAVCTVLADFSLVYIYIYISVSFPHLILDDTSPSQQLPLIQQGPTSSSEGCMSWNPGSAGQLNRQTVHVNSQNKKAGEKKMGHRAGVRFSSARRFVSPLSPASCPYPYHCRQYRIMRDSARGQLDSSELHTNSHDGPCRDLRTVLSSPWLMHTILVPVQNNESLNAPAP